MAFDADRLFEQVINDCLLLSVDPTREQQAEEGEQRRQLSGWALDRHAQDGM